MKIILKVSQAIVNENNKPYSILPTLFEVEEKRIDLYIDFETFFNNVVDFQKHLTEIFDIKKYPNILVSADNVLAKMDFCIEFISGAFERNYKISTPLTLFIQYKKDSLEDVSVHIFLQLLNKWQTFYDEFKKESEKVCLKKYQFQ